MTNRIKKVSPVLPLPYVLLSLLSSDRTETSSFPH